MNRKQQAWADAGLCCDCGGPINPAGRRTKRCAGCAVKKAAYMNARREYLNARGRCPICGRPKPPSEFKWCERCLAITRVKRRSSLSPDYWSNTPVPVECITTGERFPSTHAAAKAKGIARANIIRSANLGVPSKGERWRYISDEAN